MHLRRGQGRVELISRTRWYKHSASLGLSGHRSMPNRQSTESNSVDAGSTLMRRQGAARALFTVASISDPSITQINPVRFGSFREPLPDPMHTAMSRGPCEADSHMRDHTGGVIDSFRSALRLLSLLTRKLIAGKWRVYRNHIPPYIYPVLILPCQSTPKLDCGRPKTTLLRVRIAGPLVRPFPRSSVSARWRYRQQPYYMLFLS